MGNRAASSSRVDHEESSLTELLLMRNRRMRSSLKIQLGLAFRLGVIACLLISFFVVAERGRDQVVVVAAPGDTSVFTPMKPQRLVDTRIGLGTPQRRLQARTSVDVQVTGRLGIPSNATAVVANVIAVDADRPGYLQLLPTGQAAFGSSSTLNVDTPGQTIPNAAFRAAR